MGLEFDNRGSQPLLTASSETNKPEFSESPFVHTFHSLGYEGTHKERELFPNKTNMTPEDWEHAETRLDQAVCTEMTKHLAVLEHIYTSGFSDTMEIAEFLDAVYDRLQSRELAKRAVNSLLKHTHHRSGDAYQIHENGAYADHNGKHERRLIENGLLFLLYETDWKKHYDAEYSRETRTIPDIVSSQTFSDDLAEILAYRFHDTYQAWATDHNFHLHPDKDGKIPKKIDPKELHAEFGVLILETYRESFRDILQVFVPDEILSGIVQESLGLAQTVMLIHPDPLRAMKKLENEKYAEWSTDFRSDYDRKVLRPQTIQYGQLFALIKTMQQTGERKKHHGFKTKSGLPKFFERAHATVLAQLSQSYEMLLYSATDTPEHRKDLDRRARALTARMLFSDLQDMVFPLESSTIRKVTTDKSITRKLHDTTSGITSLSRIMDPNGDRCETDFERFLWEIRSLYLTAKELDLPPKVMGEIRTMIVRGSHFGAEIFKKFMSQDYPTILTEHYSKRFEYFVNSFVRRKIGNQILSSVDVNNIIQQLSHVEFIWLPSEQRFRIDLEHFPTVTGIGTLDLLLPTCNLN